MLGHVNVTSCGCYVVLQHLEVNITSKFHCQNYVVKLTQKENSFKSITSNMSKPLIRTYSVCASLSKYNRYVTATLFTNEPSHKRLDLLLQSFRQRWRRQNRNFFDARFLPVAIPLGITTAVCQQYSKHNEKRFFRAVQYGVDDEVKR